MKDFNMILHCGASVVDWDKVVEDVPPQPTVSHYPVPHSLLVHHVKEALTANGQEIVDEVHSLSHQGMRYFGMLRVDGSDGADHATICGIRNSHDKTFPAALALGAGVFVCDNLSFSGEVNVVRKHTRFIRRDLERLVNTGIGRLGDLRHAQENRIAAYKNFELGDKEAHDFLIRSVDSKVISASKIPKVLNYWREPEHEEFADRTLWSMFNAFTSHYRGSAPASQLVKSQALHGLCDTTCGLQIPKAFETVEV